MTNKNERFKPHNIVDDKVWNTAIYARLSDEDRDKADKAELSQSIENQVKYIQRYIEYINDMKVDTYPITIKDIYTDDDFTGINFDREAFKRMMTAVDNNVIDCIVVKNLSRLGRHDIDMQIYLEKEFEKIGKQVRIIAIGDGYDSLYDEVGIDIRIKLILNREYSETQHRNVSVAMHTMQKEGKYVGAFAPYGYKKDPEDKHHLIIDSYSAEVVKRIFSLYLDGVCMKEIAFILTKDGIVNRATYKKMQGSNYICSQKISENDVHWTTDSIKNILVNEVYTGTLVQGKTVQKRLIDDKPTAVDKEEWIRVENTHEAIIAKEDWQLAQSLMKKIKHDTTKPDEVTIFKGLLKCGDCRHAMRKKWDKYKAKDGTVHKNLYYNCATFRDFSKKTKDLSEEEAARIPKCTSHYISDKLLRKIVLSDVNTIIGQLQHLEQMVKMQMKAAKGNSYADTIQAEIEARKKNILKIQNRLKVGRDKWLDGKLTDDEYKEVQTECKDSIALYEKEVASLEHSLKKPQAVLENLWVKDLLQYGQLKELDRATVVHLIDKIYVYQDKHIEIIYKFSDEFDSLFVDRF
ncbi:MAG: recombinase family protein [Clostridiales bacterium]|nr:recombinase family protein [Clostridiales bacterium]